ncbi:hypothetical protein [Acidimangrovimonas sediminis]|uniref:hypothetical protein n=1 Tax=Acidimangrovimonas sediminis TaxID=2056283 RepID=UPI0011AF4F9C|nr:hypothetical protein [Acidimangrovimonas sediminis]
MIAAAAVTSAPADAQGATSTNMTSDLDLAADFAPPAAPMAMPKQIIERSVARGASQRLRLPFFGGRMQGQP